MEMDFYEALGVEPGGGEVSEIAEPTGADADEMRNAESEESEKETVPGGQEENVDNESDADVEPSEGDEPEGEKKTQSAEENARYAAARRKAEAERDTAIARAREEAKQYAENAVAEVLKTAGFTNPYTGQPIRTKAEFDVYAAKLSEERKNAVLEGSGMNEEQFAAFMETRPEVLEAKQAKREADEVIRQAREREAKAKIEEQLKEIATLNPAITDLAALTKLESYPAIYDMVKKGYSIADAYKLTNLAEIENRAVQRAQQQTRNAERSKAHLKSTESRGAGGIEVPEDVKAEYRLMNPGITDAEIKRHYASYAKQK